jgi:hypothetical protein
MGVEVEHVEIRHLTCVGQLFYDKAADLIKLLDAEAEKIGTGTFPSTAEEVERVRRLGLAMRFNHRPSWMVTLSDLSDTEPPSPCPFSQNKFLPQQVAEILHAYQDVKADKPWMGKVVGANKANVNGSAHHRHLDPHQ